MTKTLLPAGCYDLLPPYARQEHEILCSLVDVFDAFGYELIAPPLLEYTESLLGGRGAALAPQIFRVMDPGAHKVMGIRADITMQAARIAATRLSTSPRPLRLSYAGNVLRMQGSKIHRSRQLRQVGIELIGAASAEADAEVIAVAAEALKRSGIDDFSIDIHLPGIVGELLAEEVLDSEEIAHVFDVVTHKDISAIRAMQLKHHDVLASLVAVSGPAETVLPELKKLKLPAVVTPQIHLLETVVGLLRGSLGAKARITIDPTEARGFEYHTGLSFSFFSAQSAHELGRGGRYRITAEGVSSEATGFTLYVDTLRRMLPEPPPRKRVFIAGAADYEAVMDLQKQGYITVFGLPEHGISRDEARRQHCGFYYVDGKLENT